MNPFRPVVQAGNVVEFAAARMPEIFLAFLRNFFQRFKTIGDKAGADYIDTPGFLFAQCQ